MSEAFPEMLERLGVILGKIDAARLASPYGQERVRLMAVSKVQPVAKMKALIDAGHLLFGENYVQEAEEKIHELQLLAGTEDVQYHFIGQLQRNKVKRAVGTFSVIESVDRESLADEIAKVASKRERVQRVMLQVNTSGEDSKGGVMPEKARALCETLLSHESLKLDGLMCIGQYYDPSLGDEARARDFVVLRELRDELQEKCGVELPELSMGMSSDFELAIAHGATIVRVGTMLLGERPPK